MIAMPHLVLHCSTDFYTRDVQAENLILKRKYSALETDHVHLRQEHEVLKQKQAKLQNTVGQLQRFISQFMATNSPGLKIADQGGETTSDAGASDVGESKSNNKLKGSERIIS